MRDNEIKISKIFYNIITPTVRFTLSCLKESFTVFTSLLNLMNPLLYINNLHLNSQSQTAQLYLPLKQSKFCTL